MSSIAASPGGGKFGNTKVDSATCEGSLNASGEPYLCAGEVTWVWNTNPYRDDGKLRLEWFIRETSRDAMKAFVKGTTISRVKDTPIGRGHVPRTAERPHGSGSIAHITRVSVSQL